MSVLRDQVFVGGHDGLFHVFNTQLTGPGVRISSNHTDHIWVADNNGEDLLLLGDNEGKVSLWNVKESGKWHDCFIIDTFVV